MLDSIGTIKLRADNNNLGSGSARSRLRRKARDGARVRARVDMRPVCYDDDDDDDEVVHDENEAKGFGWCPGVTTHPNYIYPRFRIRERAFPSTQRVH